MLNAKFAETIAQAKADESLAGLGVNLETAQATLNNATQILLDAMS